MTGAAITALKTSQPPVFEKLVLTYAQFGMQLDGMLQLLRPLCDYIASAATGNTPQ